MLHDVVEPFRDSSISERFTAHANIGSPYGISEAELEILQNSSLGPQHPSYRHLPPMMPMEQAYNRLISRTDAEVGTAAFQAAIRRYHAAVCAPSGSYDLIIKMFNDLDTLIFHGDLRDRVNFRWEALDHVTVLGRYTEKNGELLGVTIPPVSWHVPRVRIRMNADVDWTKIPRWVLIGTVVHEMLHAYFYVHCGVVGYHDSITEEGMDRSHGRFFHAAARHVEAVWGLQLLD